MLRYMYYVYVLCYYNTYTLLYLSKGINIYTHTYTYTHLKIANSGCLWGGDLHSC